MGKIPKGLSDKDMFRGYEEKATLEDRFLQAEAEEEKKRRHALREKEDGLSRAALTPDLLDKLGKELLQLKLDLFAAGIKDYRLEVKRVDDAVVLAPRETKGR